MITQEEIIAGLKKIGPCRPGELADHLHLEHSALGYHLKKLLEAGIVKATGTSNARRVALPDQKFEESTGPDAPPQRRQKRESHKKAKHPRKAPRRTAPAARTAERFVPTVDAELRLHIINGSDPVSFSEQQTADIAALLLQHYDKA